ncbi:permease [Micromonospora sp. KC213]|uniref:permease n=1 Tax=Micromonospora sp. KC213 TaxID=2530378 RepID=UPI001050B68A|nr:permease [Micromonospora sp. KC213]
MAVVVVVTALLVLLVVGQSPFAVGLGARLLATWTTVFVSVLVQAVPFLVAGVVLSAAIATCVPPSFWARALPERSVLAVPVAGAAGVLLPGCECGAVPMGAALMRRGVTPAVAVTFLLAAPAVNPVVLTATAVAFPANPEMVLARGLASMTVAVTMGWLWLRWGRTDWIRLPNRPEETRRAGAFWLSLRHDILHAGGFLVVGAAAAASVNVLLPERALGLVVGDWVLEVLVLATLAVILSLCSEADAFVAASMSQFSLTARLVFLVVGPAVDLKLITMQAGVFGAPSTHRFVPATLAVAIGLASAVGAVLLS